MSVRWQKWALGDFFIQVFQFFHTVMNMIPSELYLLKVHTIFYDEVITHGVVKKLNWSCIFRPSSYLVENQVNWYDCSVHNSRARLQVEHYVLMWLRETNYIFIVLSRLLLCFKLCMMRTCIKFCILRPVSLTLNAWSNSIASLNMSHLSFSCPYIIIKV